MTNEKLIQFMLDCLDKKDIQEIKEAGEILVNWQIKIYEIYEGRYMPDMQTMIHAAFSALQEIEEADGGYAPEYHKSLDDEAMKEAYESD